MTTNQSVDLTRQPLSAGPGAQAPIPTIPFEMAVLPNGLTLIVHENRRDPLICSQLRFNVGSKDEPPGRTGFAHLFEHLMFKESAHRRGNWHKMLHAMGGLGVNGTTNVDRTNYYQTVPAAAIDQLLWMESDRMGHLLGGIDAATLADEVAVVKNEKRQREGEPYGGVFEAIATALYPKGHPYAHTVLGSFEDLDNATLETVADWHGRWYGASNAVLVLSGDISFEAALEKVQHWFGALPAGTPVRRATQWLPEVRETKRVTLYDRVPFRRIYSVWSTPNSNDPDSIMLMIAGQILSGGPHSRLVRRLVDRERLCLAIAAGQDSRYICGEFHIVATLAPGVDPEHVEAAISEELKRFIVEGPTQEELDRLRKGARKDLLRMLDEMGSITEALAENMVVYGRPDGHLITIERAEKATVEMVRDAAARWLSRKALELDVRPFEAVAANQDWADRTVAPAMGQVHAPRFPAVEQGQLSNGLKVKVARRPGIFGANFGLLLQGGSELDPEGLEGVSELALGAMNAGTARRSKFDLAETFAEAGINYGVRVAKETGTISMGALKDDVGQAMALMAEIFLEPGFPANELDMIVARQIDNMKGSALAPGSAAGRAVDRLIYGPKHVYGRRSSVMSLSAITRDDIIARHGLWGDPHRATLLLAGDFHLEEALEMAEAAFGAWRPGSPAAVQPGQSIWSPSPGQFFIERAGNAQSALRGAMASPLIVNGNAACGLFNSLFGGTFNSRLNANLRERRGWTYGAHSNFTASPQMGSFSISTDVQADRTSDALAEVHGELAALKRTRPVTSEEIEAARHAALVSLPAAWVDNRAVIAAMAERIIYDLPEDYHDGIESRIRGVTAQDIDAIIDIVGDPANYSWVVAGNPANVAAADFTLIDAEANRL